VSEEPRGVCWACGSIGLVLRLDKRQRPYLSCMYCSSKTFPRGDFGAIRFMSKSLYDAQQVKDGSYPKAEVLQIGVSVLEWARSSMGAKLPEPNAVVPGGVA